MIRRAALLLTLFAAVYLIADPRGPFALNDDFTQAEFARSFAESGVLRLPQWSYAASIPQVVLSRAIPPSNENLRFLGLLFGAAAVLLFFGLLTRLTSEPLAVACVLALNPVFLMLAGSFHSDVPALAFSLGATWALLAGRQALSSTAMGLALLTRQNHALAPLGAGVWLWRQRKLRPLALFGSALAALVFLLSWVFLVQGPTWAWLWGGAAGSLPGLSRLNGVVQTLAGFLLPMAVGVLPAVRRLPRPRPLEAAVLLIVAAAALYGWSAEGGMPLLPNILNRRGLGVIVLNDAALKPAGLWAWPPLWRLWDAACLFSSLTLIRFLFARLRGEGSAWGALSVAWPPYLALLLRPDHFDRYILAVVPATAAAIAACAKPRELRAGACLAVCLFFGAVSVVGLKDYYAWNRARWQAGEAAVRAGIPPEAVENGFDWNGQFTAERNMARLIAEKEPKDIGMWDWMALNRIRVLTSFGDAPPRADFAFAGKFPYHSPLTGRTEFVYIHALK